MTAHIYSTLTSSHVYTLTKQAPNGAHVVVDSVRIEGGANVPTKHLITPLGVVTTVTDEQLELLENNKVFQRQRERGYLTVRKDKVNVDRAVADMAGRDESAPLVEADLVAQGLVAKDEDAKTLTGSVDALPKKAAPAKQETRPRGSKKAAPAKAAKKG